MLLGLALMYNLTGQCGSKSASSTTHAPTTELARSCETTKKSIVLLLHVVRSGATITPPTNFSHPVSASCSGVALKSAAKIHGPFSVLSTTPASCNRSMLNLCWIPKELCR